MTSNNSNGSGKNGAGSNGSGTNGSGPNGSDDGPDPDDKNKVVKFPSLAERDRMRKQEKAEEAAQKKAKAAQESRWRASYKASNAQDVPFFNFGKIPPFTKWMIGALLLVNLPLFLWPDASVKPWVILHFGFIPGFFTGQISGLGIWSYMGPVTHIFIHGGWMHLIFNAIMGLALSTFFERTFGTRSCAIFWLACGVIGAIFTLILNPFSVAPIVGASGAISGLFGAVILSMYQTGQLGALGRRGPWPIVLFWLGLMVFMGLLGGEGLAWQAHIGGFVGGVALVHFRQKGIFKF